MKRTFARWLSRFAFALSLFAIATPGFAHKASDAYLLLESASRGGATSNAQLSIALKDLDAALPSLDADDDRALTYGEVRRAMPAIIGWVEGGFTLRCGNQPIGPEWKFEALERRIDGAYVRLAAPINCAAPAELALDYRLFEGIDASHRLLVGGRLDGAPVAFTVAPRNGQALVLRAPGGSGSAQAQGAGGEASRQSGPSTLLQFLSEGVHHILSGIDHLAFLLSLLLPIRLFRARGSKAGAGTVSTAGTAATEHGFGALLLTVTAFTVGHSLTLALASIGWIHASPVWVEPAIAITIMIAAGLNIYPIPHVRGDVLALVFGLIHGLAFSSVMSEAGITGPLLLWGLAGFNLGVDAGQWLVVAGWCALQWLLVRLSLYGAPLVRAGSWALIAVAGFWTLQRVSI